MTSNPDHDITMTGPETAALAPYLAELHPADLAFILRESRRYGYAAKAARVLRESAPPYRVDAQITEADHDEGYRGQYVAAGAALRALYLDDADVADAALAALDTMGAGDAR